MHSSPDPEYMEQLRKGQQSMLALSKKYAEKRRVVCAANRYGEHIVCGARHFDYVMHAQLHIIMPLIKGIRAEQGFIDQWGIYMDRVAALAVATAAGQLDESRRPKSNPVHELFSEDLY